MLFDGLKRLLSGSKGSAIVELKSWSFELQGLGGSLHFGIGVWIWVEFQFFGGMQSLWHLGRSRAIRTRKHFLGAEYPGPIQVHLLIFSRFIQAPKR